MKTLPALSLGALVLVGCQDLPTENPEPLFEISDAVHNSERAGFFFLPPLVPDPHTIGTFDPTLLPFLAVEICESDGTGCVMPLLARFTDEIEPGSEKLRIGDDNERTDLRAAGRG